MGIAKENLSKIIEKMNTIPKAQTVFITNIAGNDVNWDMSFQFNLDKEDPFYLEIKEKKVKIVAGTLSNAEIVMSGDNNAIVRICEGKPRTDYSRKRKSNGCYSSYESNYYRLKNIIFSKLFFLHFFFF